jgi:non-ribosomal peptide synthetase component E (peptide arylation enzyme)
VVLQKGSNVELNDLREHCRREGLSIQKCPEQLEFVDALPRNAMGKVLKQDLRSRLI